MLKTGIDTVEAGDLICVPKEARHWFNLCGDRTIRCIRLFQDPEGWTPHYLNDNTHESYQPLCMGPEYFEPGTGKFKSVVDLDR